MPRGLFIFVALLSFNSIAATHIYKGSCSEVERFVQDLNSQLPEDKGLEVEFCDDSFDRNFLGIKSNFKASLELSSSSGLCQNAKYVERRMTKFESPVNLGVNYESKVRLLEAYSFMRGPISAVGSVAGMYLTGVYFPVCSL